MSTTTDTGSQEYFSFAAAWNTLARSAEQNDGKAFSAAATLLDMRPTTVLRGLAFMMQQVAMIPEGNAPSSEIKDAMQSVAEVVSLIAVMLEHQNQDVAHSIISAMK